MSYDTHEPTPSAGAVTRRSYVCTVSTHLVSLPLALPFWATAPCVPASQTRVSVRHISKPHGDDLNHRLSRWWWPVWRLPTGVKSGLSTSYQPPFYSTDYHAAIFRILDFTYTFTLVHSVLYDYHSEYALLRTARRTRDHRYSIRDAIDCCPHGPGS